MSFFEPMLAWSLKDKLKHVVFPGFVQPKLDGIRLLWDGYEGWSRTGKSLGFSIPTIIEELKTGFYGLHTDGELYCKDIDFEDIVSSVRRTVNIKEDSRIQYHVFDVIGDPDFSDRTEYLLNWYMDACDRGMDEDRIILVPSYGVDSMEEIEWYLKQFEEAGYEGAIYRNAKGPYEHKRSNLLLKLKSFKDCEAVVYDFVEGKPGSKYVGMLGAFRVELPYKDGTVKCKVSGMNDELRTEAWNNKDKYYGKVMTIKFQERTRKGVPRFPVFVAWRDYE
jgi:DNA ligase-1